MINNAAFPQVGILGLGFLGQILAREFSAVPESWGTWHETPPPELALYVFSFDWSLKKTWSALPEIPVTLVLTIPPLLNNPDAEAAPAPLGQVDAAKSSGNRAYDLHFQHRSLSQTQRNLE